MNDQNQPPSSPAPDAHGGAEREREHDLLGRLALAWLREQRRARRWNITFRFIFLACFIALLVILMPVDADFEAGADRHTALVDVRGVIADHSDASADRVVTGLRAAFEDEDTAGVIVRINSPGGSPVQAGYINDELTRLRGKHPEIPVYAVITDVAASGGYYVAVAADEIYADKASVVGSIGVLISGFGFVEAMDKLGVERRLLTAGKGKGSLDPFLPAEAEDIAHFKELLAQIHRQFIDVVKRGRGDRLRAHDPRLFTGMVWTGEEGVRLGLVDALGSSEHVAREIIGAEDIVDFTPRRDYIDALATRFGETVARAIIAQSSLPRLFAR